MKSGLYAVSLSQGSSMAVLRLGWFRRDADDPDEYEVRWVTPYRGEATTKLAQVWLDGPRGLSWTFSPPVDSVAHRFHFFPLARLDPEKWAKACGPKPEDW